MGNKLGFSLMTPISPSEAYSIDLNLSRLTAEHLKRWTVSETAGVATEKFVAPSLIAYPTFDQVNGKTRVIPAFVYKPKKPGPYPVVIAIHGGPESQAKPRFSTRIQTMVDKLGAAVIAPNVRGSSGYGKSYLALDNGYLREDSVKDIGALLNYIETQSDLDESKVAVMGGSYGGYMVLASAVKYSHRLKAAIDIVGISNFVTFLKNTKSYRRDLRRVEYGDERDPKMRDFLENISPNNHVDKISVPLLIVQGENDPRVPVSEATQMVKALRGKNQEVWYMNALNEGHGFRKKENRDVYQQVVLMFLRKQLTNAN